MRFLWIHCFFNAVFQFETLFLYLISFVPEMSGVSFFRLRLRSWYRLEDSCSDSEIFETSTPTPVHTPITSK